MTIEARLARLETWNRGYRLLLALLLLLFLAYFALGAANPAPLVLKVRRLEVVGAEGRRVASFHQTDDGSGGFALYNQQGRLVVQAGVNKAGHGVLEVLNGQGRPVLDVYAKAGGEGVMVVCGALERKCRHLEPKP